MTSRIWLTLGLTVAGVVLLAGRASGQQADPVDTDNMSDTGYSDAIKAYALAIAHAEGFFVRGSIPQRANNPGDLVVPGWTGGSLGDQRISVFQTEAQGWSRLWHQLELIVNGKSHVYALDMSIADMAGKWTATQSLDWATNVAMRLGVDVDTPLSDVLL